jgi:hypothetical protein
MNPEHLYNTTATPYTWTASDPDTYGSSPTYTEGTPFSCAFDKDSGTETMTNQKESITATHYINCSVSVSLSEKDRVVIDSETYEVISTDNPMGRNDFQEILLRKRA